MTRVETEWLLRVRDLLYDLAHTKGPMAEQAECLGSFLPGYFERSRQPAGTAEDEA